MKVRKVTFLIFIEFKENFHNFYDTSHYKQIEFIQKNVINLKNFNFSSIILNKMKKLLKIS